MFSKLLANRLLMLVCSKHSTYFPKPNWQLSFLLTYVYQKLLWAWWDCTDVKWMSPVENQAQCFFLCLAKGRGISIFHCWLSSPMILSNIQEHWNCIKYVFSLVPYHTEKSHYQVPHLSVWGEACFLSPPFDCFVLLDLGSLGQSCLSPRVRLWVLLCWREPAPVAVCSLGVSSRAELEGWWVACLLL